MTGFKTPSSNVSSDSFIIRTFNTSTLSQFIYYYIDWTSSGLGLNSKCNYPCKDCLDGNPSICTSCFSDNTLNKL